MGKDRIQTREELSELMDIICTIEKDGQQLTEEEHHNFVLQFVQLMEEWGVEGGTDIIYYPNLLGMSLHATPEQIMDYIMEHKK